MTKILTMIIIIRRNYKYIERANWSLGRGTGTTTFESATLYISGEVEFPVRPQGWVYNNGPFHAFAIRSRSAFASRLALAVFYHRLTFQPFVPQPGNSRIPTLWY